MYHFNHWLSAGLQVNTTWNGGKSRKRDQEDAVWHSYLYGVVTFMPTIRFTYFHTDKNHVAMVEMVHGAFEIGGLFSTGPYEQICSRMLSMAIGYRL